MSTSMTMTSALMMTRNRRRNMSGWLIPAAAASRVAGVTLWAPACPACRGTALAAPVRRFRPPLRPLEGVTVGIHLPQFQTKDGPGPRE